jgi:mono/diheme cytochrome c family protein
MNKLHVTFAVAALAALGTGRAIGQTPDGQAVYREQCRSCHGAAGKPTMSAVSQYKKVPTFDAAFFATRSQDSIMAVLRHGVGKNMKSFKDKLSADELVAVAKYVVDTFGPKKP